MTETIVSFTAFFVREDIMERVAIYLRKSRAELDQETEQHDTLSRHRTELLYYAKRHALNIVQIYEEIISGERIQHRPEMMKLLKEVENGMYQAVLVMDMDRLGRGNMQEQGLIIDTFRESNTLIITPRKTYNLRNEFDEEYSEFEAFMARKELKIITRRLQSGRIRSAKEGNFNATYAPFGYRVLKVDSRTRTLVIHEEEADIVRLIFKMYIESNLGMFLLADRVNELGLTFKGKPFKSWNVNQILKNQVYIGKIVFNKKLSKASNDPNKKRTSMKRPEEEIVYAEGKHPPIIEPSLFMQVQQKIKLKDNPSLHKMRPLQNPLAGILKCGLCGKTMSRNCTSRDKQFIRCTTNECKNHGTKMERVEKEVVKHMKQWMKQYKIQLKQKKQENNDYERNILKSTKKDWEQLKKQKEQLHDLLEQGVYTVEMYLERSQILATRIVDMETSIIKLQEEIERKELEQKMRREYIPALINVMELYHKTDSIEQKNKLLKSVLHKVVYTKNEPTPNGFFEIALYPKLPSVEGI